VRQTRSGKTLLVWPVSYGVDGYEVTRGLLGELSSGPGECLVSLRRNYVTDVELPSAGNGFFYLVGARDAGCGGAGPLGVDSGGTPRLSGCP